MNVKELVSKHFLLRREVSILSKKLNEAKENNNIEVIESLEMKYSKVAMKLYELENTEVFLNEDLQAMLESTDQLQDMIRCIQGFIDNTKQIERCE